jgi:tRNA(Ile2) C34 agmatinyltransferase TiaS
MTDGFALAKTNAGRSCAVCGDHATAYLHDGGFRCGDCEPTAPDERPDEVQQLGASE